MQILWGIKDWWWAMVNDKALGVLARSRPTETPKTKKKENKLEEIYDLIVCNSVQKSIDFNHHITLNHKQWLKVIRTLRTAAKQNEQ
jgi:hypothetical protein